MWGHCMLWYIPKDVLLFLWLSLFLKGFAHMMMADQGMPHPFTVIHSIVICLYVACQNWLNCCALNELNCYSEPWMHRCGLIFDRFFVSLHAFLLWILSISLLPFVSFLKPRAKVQNCFFLPQVVLSCVYILVISYFFANSCSPWVTETRL